MVEHESNALSIPVWKTGVSLSTPMLEIDRISLRSEPAEAVLQTLPRLLGQRPTNPNLNSVAHVKALGNVPHACQNQTGATS
jgi:hypothetical protein